jgi:Mlc titration factor MtfA (ptsG expression regulator)
MLSQGYTNPKMRFPWSKSYHRRELLAQPFPTAWREYLAADIAPFRHFSSEQQQKLQDITRLLIAEKSWEGCGGLTLTDEIQVVIAGQAALLTLGFDGDDSYPNVETILVYPQGFLVKTHRRGVGGVLAEETVPYAGEAALQGPIVISWADAKQGGREWRDGRNVVLHEFAHKLDMRDGAADGTPYLQDAAQVEAWARVMSAEYQGLLDALEAGEPTLIDPYGATNAAEFFAVATECFFEKSHAMQSGHSELYTVLRDYYRQDPAAWQMPQKGNHAHTRQ